MNFLLARLLEPSTYLGIALLALTGSNPAILTDPTVTDGVTAIAGLIGIFLRENGVTK